MQSKLCFLYFSVLQSGSLCLQNVSKSGCLLCRASDLFYPRISLSLLFSLLSLVPNTHKQAARTHTVLHTKRGDTPGPSPPPPQS